MTKIFVAGHQGMVGSAICKQLERDYDVEIITRSRSKLDLCDQSKVNQFLASEKPDEIILAAARVGGIEANNTMPASFIYENLQIQNNVINGAHIMDIQKLLFLGSSCIYPKHARQPIPERALLDGELEPTNEPYAVAKIAGIKMCESYNRQFGRDYRSIMPTNLYGPGDNYHYLNSHVIPALIRRFHEAKRDNLTEVVIWGSGNPKREFLYVDDMAAASLFIHSLKYETYKKQTNERTTHVNVGTGLDVTIKELANIISSVVDFKGSLIFDTNKPDGTTQKLLDISKLSSLGWTYSTPLHEGIEKTYLDFKKNYTQLRK